MTTDDRPSGLPSSDPAAPTAPTSYYEIRVQGLLSARWEIWFDGMDLAAQDDGTTVIRGPVVDQAALHGLLQRLRDIGIPLLSLVEIEGRGVDGEGDHDPLHEPHDPTGATS